MRPNDQSASVRAKPLRYLLVTSKSGAAVRDIVQVAAGRCPVRLVIADCRVQGDGGPRTIVDALTRIQRLVDVAVVIVSRGGAAAEDLCAFNDELVARAIATCCVPVVSGVGREVDVTIGDLVADVRGAPRDRRRRGSFWSERGVRPEWQRFRGLVSIRRDP